MHQLHTGRLAKFFTPSETQRGKAYADEGRVLLKTIEGGRLFAEVEGEDIYDVNLDFAELMGGVVDGDCSCPAWARNGVCKHIWATIVRLNETWSAGPTAGAPKPKPTRQDYRERLRRLGTLRGLGSGSGESRLEFHVDVEESREQFWLHVELRVRKPASARQTQIYTPRRDLELDATSQRLMALLRPARLAAQWQAPIYGAAALQQHCVQLEGPMFEALEAAGGGQVPFMLNEEPLLRAEGPMRFEVRRAQGLDGETLLVGDVHDAQGQLLGLEVGDGAPGEPESVLAVTAEGWLVTDRRWGRLDETSDVALAIDFLLEGPMAPPDLELATLAPLLDTGKTSLALEELPEVESVAPTARLSLHFPERFTRHGGAQLSGQVEFGYGEGWVRPGDPFAPVVAGRRLLGRDAAAEAGLLEELRALELIVEPDPRPTPFEEHSTDVRLRFGQLKDTVVALTEHDWEVRADGQTYVRPGESSARVSSGTDWFGLEGGVDFDGTLVPLPELLAAARNKEHTVALGDGRVGLLPENWLAQWGWTELGEPLEGGALRFPREQGWLLDALLAEREGVSRDRGFAQFSRRLKEFEGIASKAPPKGFKGELRPYQEEGLGWFEYLQKLGFGGCLADDMGLGKTVQVLALLEGRRRRRMPKGTQRKPSLVVAPASVVHNWLQEAGRFAPKLVCHEHHGPDRWDRLDLDRLPDLLVTTYALLRRDAQRFGEMEFDYLILDEAQAIKNPKSQASKAARLQRAEHRLALSGTPIENRLEELWSLFEFLNPGMLGAAPAFKRLLEGGAEAASELPLIARAVRPFVLRRTKQDVLPELPPKTEQTLQIALPPAQRKVYDELARYYRRALSGADVEDQNAIQILTALLRLRQAACHPGLIDKRHAAADCAKFDELLPRLEELVAEGHKALVFSQFTELLDLLRARLDAKGLKYELLTGRTRKRAARVESFQSEEGPGLFLISLKAGGTGLNLTRADYVFLLDPWWNPAAEAQAIDRAHRIGRTRPVHAYRLVAKDTIEERVLELQESKRELAASILEPASGSVAGLTAKDLELLLG